MPALPPFEPTETSLAEVRGLLGRWLEARLDGDALDWLEGEAAAAAENGPVRRFYLAYSGACRRVGKDGLAPSGEDLAGAAALRPRWDPSRWTREECARTWLLLHRPPGSAASWRGLLDPMFACADLGEAVALYRSLPLLPLPVALVARAAEGVRTNITDVFAAVAHRNPFPAERFDEAAWNQMVLKALFVGIPLGPVVGFAERRNPALARMARDYAAERRAAGREVPADLALCLGEAAPAEAP